MNARQFIIPIIALATLATIIMVVFSVFKKVPTELTNAPTAIATETKPILSNDLPTVSTKVEKLPTLLPPISRALERISKKPFGMLISPDTSPVENDRFNGYHVGVDFETFSEEQNFDVPITAICSGPLILKKFATGYGGVMLQKCTINEEEVSVIYGHLRLSSVQPKAGEEINMGELVGFLGQGHSSETDGVRKHLHLGIKRGTVTDIRGYIKNPAEMNDWLDFQKLLLATQP